MVNTPPATPIIEDEGKLLDEALQVVKVQAFHMKKFLVCCITDDRRATNSWTHSSTRPTCSQNFEALPLVQRIIINYVLVIF
jgi:hypothetical protein